MASEHSSLTSPQMHWFFTDSCRFRLQGSQRDVEGAGRDAAYTPVRASGISALAQSEHLTSAFACDIGGRSSVELQEATSCALAIVDIGITSETLRFQPQRTNGSTFARYRLGKVLGRSIERLHGGLDIQVTASLTQTTPEPPRDEVPVKNRCKGGCILNCARDQCAMWTAAPVRGSSLLGPWQEDDATRRTRQSGLSNIDRHRTLHRTARRERECLHCPWRD